MKEFGPEKVSKRCPIWRITSTWKWNLQDVTPYKISIQTDNQVKSCDPLKILVSFFSGWKECSSCKLLSSNCFHLPRYRFNNSPSVIHVLFAGATPSHMIKYRLHGPVLLWRVFLSKIWTIYSFVLLRMTYFQSTSASLSSPRSFPWSIYKSKTINKGKILRWVGKSTL